MSFIRVDFPEPDTPVTTVKVPSGNFTDRFFRLCSDAPVISKTLPLPARLSAGIGIYFLWLRYCPVIDSLQAIILFTSPSATTFPPADPAPGPISII